MQRYVQAPYTASPHTHWPLDLCRPLGLGVPKTGLGTLVLSTPATILNTHTLCSPSEVQLCQDKLIDIFGILEKGMTSPPHSCAHTVTEQSALQSWEVHRTSIPLASTPYPSLQGTKAPNPVHFPSGESSRLCVILPTREAETDLRRQESPRPDKCKGCGENHLTDTKFVFFFLSVYLYIYLQHTEVSGWQKSSDPHGTLR